MLYYDEVWARDEKEQYHQYHHFKNDSVFKPEYELIDMDFKGGFFDFMPDLSHIGLSKSRWHLLAFILDPSFPGNFPRIPGVVGEA